MTRNRGYTYREQIGRRAAGRSVLDHLVATHGHSDVAVWSARLAAGEVDRDGVLADGHEMLADGQVIAWRRPPWDEADVPLHFDVAHDDADVLVVSKPAGLPTMAAGGFLEHTLLTIVRERFGDVHAVHRLGRFTSGLVLFARSHDAGAAMARAWRTQAVTKDYRALVAGDPNWDQREIAVRIGPVPHPALGTVHAASADGRPAHSVATVVERRGDTALVDVRISTGRPHQIRIHLAAAGHPLTGDPLYVVGGRPRPVAPGLPGDGGYLLHAHRLQLAHPRGGVLSLDAPLPAALRSRAEATGGA